MTDPEIGWAHYYRMGRVPFREPRAERDYTPHSAPRCATCDRRDCQHPDHERDCN